MTIKYYAELVATTTDGSVATKDDSLIVSNASSGVTLQVDRLRATSYRYSLGDSAMKAAVKEKSRRCNCTILCPTSAAAILRTIDVCSAGRKSSPSAVIPLADVATDKRMQKIKAGGEDLSLLAIYFQYGRYMLISSSRPGTMASNLQRHME